MRKAAEQLGDEPQRAVPAAAAIWVVRRGRSTLATPRRAARAQPRAGADAARARRRPAGRRPGGDLPHGRSRITSEVRWTLIVIVIGVVDRRGVGGAPAGDALAQPDREPARRAARRRLLDSRPLGAGAAARWRWSCARSTTSGPRSSASAPRRSSPPRSSRTSWRRSPSRCSRSTRTRSCCSSTRPPSSCIGKPGEEIVGQPASALGFDEYLSGEPRRLIDRSFGGRRGRYEVRRATFYRDGRPHHLVVHGRLEPGAARGRAGGVAAHRARAVARDQQLAHADQVHRALAAAHRRPRDRLPAERGGAAGAVADRGAIGRARPVPPRRTRSSRACPSRGRASCSCRRSINRIVELEKRLPVSVQPSPDVRLVADSDQLEQLLINVVRNAVDASLETGGARDARLEDDRRTGSSSSSRTRARGCRTRRTCSCRSSRPSRTGRASASR